MSDETVRVPAALVEALRHAVSHGASLMRQGMAFSIGRSIIAAVDAAERPDEGPTVRAGNVIGERKEHQCEPQATTPESANTPQTTGTDATGAQTIPASMSQTTCARNDQSANAYDREAATPAPVGEADPDDMCPNCVTPWKCNEPHVPWPPAPLSSPRRTRDEGTCDHDCAVIVSYEDYQRSEGVCVGCGVRMKNDTETGWGPLLPFGDVPCGSRVGECCPPHKFTNEGAPDVCDTCGDSEHPPASDEGTEDEAYEAFVNWYGADVGGPTSYEMKQTFVAGYRQSLIDAADAIQALHPGEVKNSVIWLRARAARLAGEDDR